MKTWTVLAMMIVLGGVRVGAQEPAAASDDRVLLELLELEQDVDKTLLREAMLLVGRSGIKRSPDKEDFPGARMGALQVEDLKAYIADKKSSIIARSAELKKRMLAVQQGNARPKPAPLNQATPSIDAPERQRLIEKREAARVEIQLLQVENQLYQGPMNAALQALAAADFAASNDASMRAKAETARQEFDKAKAKYVECTKKLWLEEAKVSEFDQRLNSGGMSGMGGMGGGMR